MRANRTSGSMRRGERRVMGHSADGHRTRKGGNSGAPPALYTTALVFHSTFSGAECLGFKELHAALVTHETGRMCDADPRLMPPLIRRYIKTGFAFLLLGMALGAYATFQVNVRGRGVPWPLITAHVHLVLVGFMLMLVFGVASWMFPRPARDDARYRPWLAEVVYWVLTVSTAARTVGELASAVAGVRGGSWLAAVGGFGQLGAALLFVVNMWVRVRMPTAAPPVR